MLSIAMGGRAACSLLPPFVTGDVFIPLRLPQAVYSFPSVYRKPCIHSPPSTAGRAGGVHLCGGSACEQQGAGAAGRRVRRGALSESPLSLSLSLSRSVSQRCLGLLSPSLAHTRMLAHIGVGYIYAFVHAGVGEVRRHGYAHAQVPEATPGPALPGACVLSLSPSLSLSRLPCNSH